MAPPPAPDGEDHAALSPARRAAPRFEAPAGPNGGSSCAKAPATEARGAARTPAAHAAPGEADDSYDDAEALAVAEAEIDALDNALCSALPCPCGVHDAVHECALAVSARRRKAWVLSVPDYVLCTDAVRCEGGARGRQRVVLCAYATEDNAWERQAQLRAAHALLKRVCSRAAPLPARAAGAAKPMRVRRRVQLPEQEGPPDAAAAQAGPSAGGAAWVDLDDDDAGGAGAGFDSDAGGAGAGYDSDSGPDDPELTKPKPSKASKAKKVKPSAVWRVEPVQEQDTQEGLEARYIGSRVFYDGLPGVVKGIEPHLEYTFLFNVRYDDGRYGDIELREIEDAATAAAAAGHHPAAVRAAPVRAPVQAHHSDDDEVIVISDDESDGGAGAAAVTFDDDDVVELQQGPRRTRRASAPTPAPRRAFRKSARPAKRARSSAPAADSDDDDDDDDAVLADTQPAAPVLELSAVSPATLVRLSSQITLRLNAALSLGAGPFGKLSRQQIERLMELLIDVDKQLLSAYLRFEGHGDEKQLCSDWRALLR